MTFIENNLIENEEIIHKAKIHWLIFFTALFWSAVAAGVYYYGKIELEIENGSVEVFTIIFMLLALWHFAKATLHKYFTELAITDRRMIAKFGFIRRETIEIPLLKVESVLIDQSILERIMGSGSVAVHGTGSAMAPVKYIDAPVEFRNQLNNAMSKARDEYKEDAI